MSDLSPAGPPGVPPDARVDLVLTAAGTNKIAVIKEVRGITGLGLKEAKDLVDRADHGPQIVAGSLDLATARQWAQQLADAGATSEVRTYA